MRASVCRSVVLIALLTALGAAPLTAQPASPQAAAAPFGQVSQAADEPFRAWLERTDLGRMLRRDATRLQVRKATDGAEALVMDEGFRSVIVLQTGEDSQPVTSCIMSIDAAEAIFGAGRAPLEKAP